MKEMLVGSLNGSFLIELREHQVNAIASMRNGCVLYSGVGAGKSATALAYYVKNESPKDIYVITTAKKRDALDWDGEASRFGIGREPGATLHGTLTVDSWNNIGKYTQVQGGFFIFDEQRLVGSGAWVKSYLKIARRNRWILLSATPGDTWIDYAPAFIANGWYENITDFKRQHVVYAPYVKFPQIVRYLGEDKLERLRNALLVEMPYDSHAYRHINYLPVGYDKELLEWSVKRRWNPFSDLPMKDAAEMWRVMRRIVNEDPSRLEQVVELMKTHPRLVVFYNFDYELNILRLLGGSFFNDGTYEVAEWNGHKKQPIPDSERWVYLVQYQSGAEGWNCTTTDTMVLYSLTYSYKNFVQAMGRIDRLDSANIYLYYYILVSSAYVDKKIKASLDDKKSFNEQKEAKNVDIRTLIS